MNTNPCVEIVFSAMEGDEMRAIELWMLKMIHDKACAEASNTAVVYDEDERISGVFLFGNHLGNMLHDSNTFEVNVNTLEANPSNITMSRLRALGVDVHRKDNVLYLYGNPLVEIVGRYI